MLLSKVSKPLLHPTSPMMYSSSSAFLSQRDEMTDVKELKHRRKTIVFVSCLFSGSEPHGQLVLDVIKRLPKVIFECAAVGIGSKTPGKNFLSAVNGKYYAAGHDRDKAAQLIMSLNPECIVYVENLNSPIIHFLAYERFAPIQILLMGGPLTAGIPSIDYFLSGDRLEHVSSPSNILFKVLKSRLN
jgi:predicted O-linked N-acetylglucosamine transferase (SPINDLY family)